MTCIDKCKLTAHKIKHTLKGIDAFVGNAPQFDDITMLCLEYRERMQNEGIDN